MWNEAVYRHLSELELLLVNLYNGAFELMNSQGDGDDRSSYNWRGSKVFYSKGS